MKLGTPKMEAFLRVFAILMLVLTAILLGLDNQTKTVFYVEKHVTYKYLKALLVLVYVDAVAAACNLLQLGRCYLLDKGNFKNSYYIYLAWGSFLLDQIGVYVAFAATSAALEHSVLVVTGAEAFSWLKWCNKFSRFCIQVGGALLCGYLACIIMTIISVISAFNLFRLYSPKHILHLKTSTT
ncbi:CASP-like protein 2C1 [Mercurialis annua]|uniref:CASP-like protein 2C1 n=1 Tax=Mercurialis annua TaxID=3986 RepID=UPI002160D83A|nr:CASP-like protein 2C1 [Mercurialis annua]